MNVELDPTKITKQISGFLYRYHIVIFAVLAVGGIAISTYFLGLAMATPESDNLSAPISKKEPFDTETMNKIDRLNTNSTPLKIPKGQRTDPFASGQ